MELMLNLLRGATIATALLAAGCNTGTIYYMPPVDLTADTAASISGSKTEATNVFTSNIRVFVTHIDSAATHQGIGSGDQDKVFLVKPGTRSLRIMLRRYDMWGTNTMYASIEQSVELEAGKIYVARGRLSGREAALWVDEVGTAKEQGRRTEPVTVVRPIYVPVYIPR